MARLSVAVLGAPEVRHGDRLLAFPTRKALALLVYLVTAGGTPSRDKLAALFWPDSDGDAGRATLRSTLARLREAIDAAPAEPHLLVERHRIGIVASDIDVDLHRLDAAHDLARAVGGEGRPDDEARHALIARLQQGADAWRGEFLDGFSLRDAPEFDDWAGLQREVWRRRMETVLDRLSLLQGDAGEGAAAIETVNRWLRLNPLEERAHRRLMRLHAAAGDRAAALRAYATCRAALESELAVPPAPETEALAERIRAMTGRSTAARRPAPRRAAPTSFEGPLVGRADEFTALVEWFHAAARGQTQAVVLHGEAGIGKTRLATEFVGWAQARGAEVLQGRAFETGSRLPYQPLVDALRARLEPDAGPEIPLTDIWLAELSRLLPELRDRRPGLPAPGGDEAAARTRLFEAVARLGRALAKQAPLVVFVDDVQWADIDSLDVLRYAARRWAHEGTRSLLLVCQRSEALAATPALDEWLLGLRRDLPVAQIDLGPLTLADTLRLLGGGEPAADSDRKAFARWLFTETDGQPFFLVETVRALLDRGALASRRGAGGDWEIEVVQAVTGDASLPPSVRRVIHARLSRLAPTTRDLLVAAAIIGQDAAFELLAQIAGLAEDDGLTALDDALQGHLLVETADGGGRGYVFTHDKIRGVAYSEASEARRRVFHRRALAALEAVAAPAAELARHALAAGADDAALRFSVAAGDDAMRLLAARDAAAHYERAIALAERLRQRHLLSSLHARRGHAFVSVAMWPEARRELEAAVAGLDPDEEHERAEILVDLAEACWWSLDVPAMQRHATAALSVANRIGRSDLEMKAMAWLAAVESSAGNLIACVDLNRRAIDRARALGIAPLAIAKNYESMALYWLGRLDEAVASNREAVAMAREANAIPWAVSSLPQLGASLAGIGRYAEAADVFREARRLGHEFGVESMTARAIAISAGYRLDLFDFDGAEALSAEARELARSVDFLPPAVSAGIDLMLNYARRHEVARAEALVGEVAAVAARATDFHGWLWALRLAEARAEIALARGDWEEARRRAEQAIAQSQARGRVKYEILGRTSRAQALVAQGRAPEAIADLQAALALARSFGDPALFLRTAVALLALDGDDALRAEARATAERIAAALPDPEARRRFESAGALRGLVGGRRNSTPGS